MTKTTMDVTHSIVTGVTLSPWFAVTALAVPKDTVVKMTNRRDPVSLGCQEQGAGGFSSACWGSDSTSRPRGEAGDQGSSASVGCGKWTSVADIAEGHGNKVVGMKTKYYYHLFNDITGFGA